ncbi:Bgt-1089 [Blumeria graminis f. sp. tritici]|uniref:Bgt-1089 n=2 Tax=Blumeria graminis f. sp. tritici TaxID=62690 RepID=A0A381LAA6_BLUGR|nr:hypothetical protein BGT96224_1089 [Blumeria graminis f. sp. tritici 96224]VDB90650.1 Bgt-1089 [Blumeria graminis f. sp. tritici]
MVSFSPIWSIAFGLVLLSTVNARVEASPQVSPALQKILDQAYEGPLYTYPTSLTQGILPKAIHSHNDYWRPLPFYTALSVGAVSVEADVWLFNDTLYVGHEPLALTSARTFESLYIKPILDTLNRQNPDASPFVPLETYNGVFDMDGGQTLYLWVDVKTDGAKTWPAVVKALEPLRSRGYLASSDDKTFRYGPVTVIGTGNTPLDLVKSANPRNYFFDAPISALDNSLSDLTYHVSPVASAAFSTTFGGVSGSGLNEGQLALLRKHISVAHPRGIRLRYWDQPGWPYSTRNQIWRQLKGEGVDFINADDVEAAAGLGNMW